MKNYNRVMGVVATLLVLTLVYLVVEPQLSDSETTAPAETEAAAVHTQTQTSVSHSVSINVDQVDHSVSVSE